MSKKKTHEEYVKELSETNPNIEVIENYTGYNTPIEHYCNKHDIYWYISPYNALCGKGCKECGKEKQIKNSRKLHDKYVEELKSKNPIIEVVDQYMGAKTSILHHCLVHDIFWNTTPDRALQGVGCPECKKERLRSCLCKTHEQYVKEVESLNSNIIVTGMYVDSKTPIEHHCKKHNVFWNAYPESILRGGGCQECWKEKIGDKNSKTHEQYVDEVSKVNPNIEVIEKYIDSSTAILHRCKKHNVLWYAYPTNILRGHGCSQCNESNGEKQIRQWLDDRCIEYIPQKTFDDCRNRRVLPFDFYIPTCNLCIEYDGEQHFRTVDYFGGNEGFEQRKRNDEIKNQYCKDHNIRLLRIPYYKNVEEELNNFLFI